MFKRSWSKMLVLILVLTLFVGLGSVAMASDVEVAVKKQIDKNLAYMLKTVDNPTLGGEWSVLCLARGNYPVPKGYYEKFQDNAAKMVKEKKGNLHSVKYSEHSRLILGLTSVGKNVTDVGGYNQLEKLADFKTLTVQGINGPIWALIALDSHDYEIPKVEGLEMQTTREILIEYILNREISGGGWDLSATATNPDSDITAMAIQGLTPYYDQPNVKAAIDRGIIWLSNNQKEDGGYDSWDAINSESIAQVVVALTGLGIDPHKDPRFIKNGNSVIDALLSFAVPEGGFIHVKAGTDTGGAVVNAMATEQGTYALIAYDRFLNDKNAFYDMTDVNLEAEEDKSSNDTNLEKIYTDTNDISSWAYKSIEDASQKGFIQGSDGKFNPKASITRAEFTKIIVSILDIDTKIEGIIKFTDVKEGDWHYEYINSAYKLGIITGSGDKFNPNDKITREQMAAIIVRAFEIETTKPDVAIKDFDKVSSWAKEVVETAVASELIVGNNNLFDPQSFATREMATVVLMRGKQFVN